MRGTGDPADDTKSAAFLFGVIAMLAGILFLALGFVLYGFALRVTGLICLVLGACLAGCVYLLDKRDREKSDQK